jgi:Transposase DDE domain
VIATGSDILVSPVSAIQIVPRQPRGKLMRGRCLEMQERLSTPRGRELYGRRKQLVEPVFAQTKVIRRADRFQRRALAACRSEWRLIAATHNLLKLWRCRRATAPDRDQS